MKGDDPKLWLNENLHYVAWRYSPEFDFCLKIQFLSRDKTNKKRYLPLPFKQLSQPRHN